MSKENYNVPIELKKGHAFQRAANKLYQAQGDQLTAALETNRECQKEILRRPLTSQKQSNHPHPRITMRTLVSNLQHQIIKDLPTLSQMPV